MRPLVAAIAAVLVLSACQDPADVGLGLIDEEQQNPGVLPLGLTDLATTPDTTIAIGIAAATNVSLVQSRVLVGRVADPLFGDARAVAYVDFIQSSSLSSSAEAAEVSAAWLELPRTYVYGDSTTTLPLELRAIQGTWTADGDYPADTLFATGEALATAVVAVSDTLQRFDLPASWVSTNAATLVSDDFSNAFEGFAIDVPTSFAAMPGAVMGFDTFADTGAGLRVVVADDTLVYPLSEVFSSIANEAPTMAPPGLLAVRSGSGSLVGFTVDFASVGPSALARAQIRLPIDESLTEEGSFVRPLSSRLILYGIREGTDGDRLAIAEFQVQNGELVVTDTSLLTPIVQQILLSPDTAFDRYEVAASRGTASLDIVPIQLTGATTESGPRFTLVIVGPTG